MLSDIDTPPRRIASLLPSATEIVSALGFAHHLVGRSHECDFPPEVAALPVLTAPKVPMTGTSREIDQSVASLLERALSVYRVDEQGLRDLQPDLVVTQSQCEVCAVSLSEVQAALGGWIGSRPRILSFEPNRLEDVWRDIERAGHSLGDPAAGLALAARLRGRVQGIAQRAESAARPSVATVEWADPLMAAGNWVPELIALAGGRNLFGEPGRHAPILDWEALRQADPDVIILMPCGFDLERTLADVPLLQQRDGWSELAAVRANRVFATDGNQYFNRPGPRLAESLEILAEILHPERFDLGHHGIGWVRVPVS